MSDECGDWMVKVELMGSYPAQRALNSKIIKEMAYCCIPGISSSALPVVVDFHTRRSSYGKEHEMA